MSRRRLGRNSDAAGASALTQPQFWVGPGELVEITDEPGQVVYVVDDGTYFDWDADRDLFALTWEWPWSPRRATV